MTRACSLGTGFRQRLSGIPCPAACGNVSCIAALVQRVISQAPVGTQVIPAIAGVWGNSVVIALEAQMQAIRLHPKFESEPFLLFWQEPQFDERKSCRPR